MKPETPGGAQWIDATQAAQLLGVSSRSIQRRCRAGKLPARLVSTTGGQQWEINAQALAEGNDTPDTNDTDDTLPPTRTTHLTTGRTTPNDTTGATQTTPPTSAPDADFLARYVAQIEAENRFLKSQIEEGNRNAAELRAALREALKATARQLEQGDARNTPGRTENAPMGAECPKATNTPQSSGSEQDELSEDELLALCARICAR